MLRIFVLLVLILIVLGAVIGSAGSLTIDVDDLTVFVYRADIPLPEPSDCTYSIGYWRSHADA